MTSQLQESIQTIERSPWFFGLDKAVLERFAESARLRSLGAGDALSRRGQPHTHLSFVQSGSLELSIHGRDGKRHVTRRLLPGEVYGLIPVLDGGNAIHDAEAHVPTEILELPRGVLVSELLAQPTLAMRLLQLLCGRSRQLYEMFAFQQLLPLHARVAYLILVVGNVEPQQIQGIPEREIEIHMTQAELSDMLGVSRQSLSTELKKLERQGLIRIAHAKIAVTDAKELASLTHRLL